MRKRHVLTILFLVVIGLAVPLAGGSLAQEGGQISIQAALDTAFTYQGQLKSGGTPVNGNCDFQFSLWDAASGGTQIGATQTKSNVTVSDGIFTTSLDFGSAFTGDARWLEIAVRCPVGSGAYTTLSPRQALTAVPYALYAKGAPWSGLTGVPAGFVDGVDNDTTYTAGTGLSLNGTQFNVTGAPWSGLTGVPAGFADGVDNDTTYTAGMGLDLSGGAFSIRPTYRLPQNCANGQIAKWNGSSSSWECGNDDTGSGGSGDITAVNAGTGLSGGGTSGDVTLSLDTGFTDGRYWKLGGNAGTNPATHFLGTTDGLTLTLAVSGTTALRLGPSSRTPNLIGGYSGNSVTAGVVGATIGGGGAYQGDENFVTDDYGTVGGGGNNQAGNGDADTTNAPFATVGGGRANTANDDYATVGGGHNNTAGFYAATVAGGENNTATGGPATVGGGSSNTANGEYATVGGGLNNAATSGATVAGGQNNTANGNHATVGGGFNNTAGGNRATVGGGNGNTAGGSYATVAGGNGNTANGDYATVAGGVTNSASGVSATVGGGSSNTASNDYATVGGGYSNTASFNAATVGGGDSNVAGGEAATVGGGAGNTASNQSATVSGGTSNTASGAVAVVGGGSGNTASGWWATIPGGVNNTAAGDYSLAAGRRARANYDGTFVWADSTNSDFASTAANQFLVRAGGGVGLGTNAPQAQLHVVEAINGSASLENHVAIIENNATSTNNGPDVLALKSSATGNPGANTNFITFFDGDGPASLGAIQGDGNGGVTLVGPGNDYAEWLPLREATEAIQPGDIVAWTPQGITRRTEQALRLMVVSTQPIVAGNAPMQEEGRRGWAPVAFVGQAPVRVRGPVQAGDFILPSGWHDGSGVAVSATNLALDQVRQVVGQALESAPGEGLHTVKVLVGLPQNDILQALLAQRDAQLAALEARVQALERGGQAGLWPGIGLALLVGAMLGAGRRRREQGAQASDRSDQDVPHSWL